MRKKAIVTGGSRGIGREICLRLARDGYDVVLTYLKEREAALDVVEEISALGGTGWCLGFDCGVAEEAELGILEGMYLLGGLDALVCNAGVAYSGLLTDMSVGEWQRVMDVNLHSLFYASKPAISEFVRVKSGNIVVISSMWGQVGASCEVAYSTAKAGGIGFVKALAQELAPSGVRVNCVAPGVIETEMLSGYSEEEKRGIREEIPLGRLGTGGEVASCVSFLLSEDSGYMTGQVVAPNGGYVV